MTSTQMLPQLQLHSGVTGAADPQLSLNQAAAVVGSTPHMLSKLLEGGYLPDLSRASLAALFGASFVSTPDKSLAIAQMAVASHDGTWRPLSGLAVTMTPFQVVEAGRGDWTGAPTDIILGTGLLGLGLGGWSIALLRATGLDHTPKPEPRTARYEAELIAMLSGPLGSGSVTFGEDVSDAEREFAGQFLGRRYIGAKGGSITKV